MSKYIFYFIVFALGIILGVTFCNWSFFKLNSEISISDLLILVISSSVAIYIGSNIQRALSKRQTSQGLFFDETKKILSSLETFDVWIDNKRLPFEECKKYFKKNSLALTFCQTVFATNGTIEAESFDEIINDFNKLKRDALSFSPTAGNINLDAAQALDFEIRFAKIRERIFILLLR